MTEEQKSAPPRTSGWRTFGLVTFITVKWLIIFGLIIGLFAGGAVTGYVASLVSDEPVRPLAEIEEKINENDITGFVYFNDDSMPVGQLRTEEDRRLVTMEEIPPVVIDAVLAIEDNNFNEHYGVDINGLGRAVKQKLLNEDIQTGGSTLTQQLARRVFLSLDVTDSRKFKEIFLSLRMERYLTKTEILTAYLNKVPFGKGASGYNLFGIKAAAKGVFDITDLNKLNTAQAAYLAGLPQRPTAYSAFNSRGEFNEEGFGYAMDRQQLVLRRMMDTGRITQEEYNEAIAFDIRMTMAKPNKKAYATYPYLMLEAERQAAEILLLQDEPTLTKADLQKSEHAGRVEEYRQKLLRGGYHIYTTIDKRIYNMMREIGNNADNFVDTEEKGIQQVAAIMIDHKTGAIVSMLEGRDFNLEQMNHATQMTRQPGSTMKTLGAYLPALESGKIQPGGVVDDAPMVLPDAQKGFHIPMNSNNRFYGLVTAREALDRSLNLPALKLFLEDVTIPEAWDFTRKLGITTLQPSDEHAQTGVIGGLSVGVTVEELTNAYGSIPNQGLFNDAYMIRKITDAHGNLVYKHELQPERVFSEQTAFLMTDMLRTTIANGRGTGHDITSRFNKYGTIPVAGKTGSTQGYGDVWFVGYTPDLTMGVWSGYKSANHKLTGENRKSARHIWTEIMNQVTEARPELFPTQEFIQPDGVVKATVSSVSGKVPSSLTRQFGRLVTDWFNEEYLPTEPEDALVKMAFITYNGVNYIAHDTTPSDFIFEEIVIKRKKPLGELMKEIADAQSKMPASSRRPLSAYLPPDSSMDAPSELDPRVDDGRAPSPPSSVRANANGSGNVTITFQPSPERDVVGYRLYRKTGGGSFQKTGSSLLAGGSNSFTSSVSFTNNYEFYVTAVDVAGNESSPSLIAGTSGNIIPPPGTSSGGSGNGNNNPEPETPAVTPVTPPGSETTPPPAEQEPGLSTPDAPSGIRVQTTDIGVLMTWSANPVGQQIVHYNVYYSETGSGTFSKIGASADPRFEYVSPIRSGWFRVTAVNEKGESLFSGAVELK
ncbi:transglycosylase domain-containing protein [Paenibacillus daejeonensis]|uniref:transglycosylase domain-containing protein n=1 Tax=Paenibacillus daejeonensis TaxID=135193 RepID=UPI000373BD16|nr:transglycosylase domain-containing protein [Paenibacillus daejeonensis]